MAKTHSPQQVLDGPNKGRWRVSIGYQFTNGKRVQKQFWLGKDELVGIRLTTALEAAWACETATDLSGKKIWTEESIAKAFAFVPTPAAPSPTPAVVKTLETPTFVSKDGVTTLYQGLDRFIAYMKERCTRNDIGERHYLDQITRIKGIKGRIADMRLDVIDYEQLEKIRGVMTSRPPAIKSGEPMKISVLRNWLGLLGSAFEYFSHPKSKIRWQPPVAEGKAPGEWTELFVLSQSDELRLSTTTELKALRHKKQFEINDLIIPYRRALPKEQMYLLMGVCLGWTQIDISTLRIDDIVEKNGEMFIEKIRSKTKVFTEFWVCPELADLIRRFIKQRPSASEECYNSLAFLTENGLPLKHGKTDNVKMAWDQLHRRLVRNDPQIKWYSFKHLRKTAGQLVENISGNHSLAQMVMSQTTKDVAYKHYVSKDANVGVGQTQFQRLHHVQRQVHEAIQPLFKNAKEAKPKKSAA